MWKQHSSVTERQTRLTRLAEPRNRRMPRIGRLGKECGAQLLEFALSLPFLLVLVVGSVDFGRSYNTRHVLTNAAREAARIAVSNPMNIFNAKCSGDCAIQAAADATKAYLVNAGFSQANCIDPANPNPAGPPTWTFTCTGANKGVSLAIDHNFIVTGGAAGLPFPATQVTLTYPFTWTFQNVIGLLVKGSNPNLPTTITTTVVMQNLVSG